ncbi:hypothetical protein VCRA2128O96_20250 [Vibrio crassostreae]|nr:hypothetical protein VCRA2128O96_20250 [Vibrio crassostreae]
MRFSHEGANTRAGTNAFSAIELNSVSIFGDVLGFDGSIVFNYFRVSPPISGIRFSSTFIPE